MSRPDQPGRHATGTHHVPVFTAPDDPKFKRRRARFDPDSRAPRYAPLMSIVWVAALFIVCTSLLRGITGKDWNLWDWHRVSDAGVALALLVAVSFLWSAWEREERFPQLLPKKEFDRRYPPSSAAGPTMDSIPAFVSEGGVLRNPYGDHRDGEERCG